MRDRFAKLRDLHVAQVLDGPGHTEPVRRRAAAENGELPADLKALVEKIHHHAHRVTDEELAALRSHHSDDELFELIVSAAVGASLHRLERGLQALDALQQEAT